MPARGHTSPILVVEDDESLRALIEAALEQAGYAVSLAGSGEEALRIARAVRPAVVVLDVGLPGISGYEACHRLREEHGDGLAIVIVSGYRTESADRVAGLLIGADDYLVKPFAAEELVARVRALGRRVPPGAAGAAASLTPREREILCLLAAGSGQREIAERLVISPKTVGTHIERILGKLGVHSRAQAVAVAYRDGLVGTEA